MSNIFLGRLLDDAFDDGRRTKNELHTFIVELALTIEPGLNREDLEKNAALTIINYNRASTFVT